MVNKIHHVPNMILIGSTARNSGKTTMAVAIIQRYKEKYPVIGVKVTTIAKKNGGCIRGGDGCGVCSSLSGDFEISEELNKSGNKDTSMLLASGADKVYWLKVLHSHTYEGFEALLKKIPKDALIVCESNSLRKVVKPGLFVMVKNTEDNQLKKTAKEVIDQADIVFENYFQDDFDELINEIDIRMNLSKDVSR
ncbi:hypothetical protein AKG39_01290 [Acetobacterium bakii]|uniref:Molybdopterin-guanine dinucleotide biosynthesis protein B (MobB) domain-containing protein n=1 Tax=Acetobacterium bakii TaxID=52689 RepID=A0A0L6U541_9FIRM|nr:hypothetical protein [Acetobacterium bakii]KNZ43437.1 hypothetical protein AKG39_01290 [Acetobacterium bakii]